MIRELVQGQEAATQLKLRLQNPFGADGSLSVEELAANVLRSFTETLSVMMTPSSSDEEPLGGDEVACRDLLSSGKNGSPVVASGSDNIPRSEDCGESRKRSLPVKKDRRGCYKRRKTAQTWTTVAPSTYDDHAWRKYGQKEILNSKFPRNYFRCTRKHDEGCPAAKQVQLTQQNPDMYQITYIGIHTCKATPKAQQYLVTDTSTWESYLVNSNPNDSKVPNEQVHPISFPSLTTIKQDPKEHTPSDVTDHKLDIDFGVDSVHFRTDFHFDGDGNHLL